MELNGDYRFSLEELCVRNILLNTRPGELNHTIKDLPEILKKKILMSELGFFYHSRIIKTYPIEVYNYFSPKIH